MTQLRYESRTTVDAADEDQFATLAEALRQAVLHDEVEMTSGRLRFEDDEIRVRFGLEKKTTVEDAATDRDDLAGVLVELDLEPDEETAIENIRL